MRIIAANPEPRSGCCNRAGPASRVPTGNRVHADAASPLTTTNPGAHTRQVAPRPVTWRMRTGTVA